MLIAYQDSNLILTNDDINVINNLVQSPEVVTKFHTENFSLEASAALLADIYAIIPIDKHQELYTSVCKYLRDMYIDVDILSSSIIKAVFLVPFVLMNYKSVIDNSRPTLSKWINYYTNCQNSRCTLRSQDDIIHVEGEVRPFVGAKIYKNGQQYTVIDIHDIFIPVTTYFIYSCMVKAREPDVRYIQSQIASTHPDEILHLLRTTFKHDIVSIEKKTISSTSESISDRNDLYMLNNQYSHMICMDYDNEHCRVILPILQYNQQITYDTSQPFNGAAYWYYI